MVFSKMQYTHKEMTVADQKSSQAVTLAKQVLQDKYGVQKVNISKMQGVPEMITIKQLSELVEGLIEDSMYCSQIHFVYIRRK
jgi:hypothetical protein